jgi:hypothetical protein
MMKRPLMSARQLAGRGRRWSRWPFQRAGLALSSGRYEHADQVVVFHLALSDAALRLLGDQMGQSGKSVYVFPGRPRAPLSNMSMSMLLRRMGESVTVHGFRTSFRTWCSDIAHAEFEVAESALSHLVGDETSRSYNRTDLLERRRPIMSAWANYVEGKDNVVPISKPRIRAPYRRA